jgi:acetyl-CoA synthetase
VFPNGKSTEKLVVYVVVGQQIEINLLKNELNILLADKLNPLFKVFKLIIIDKLPRTASNKIMHRMLRDKLNKDIL